MTTAPSSIVAGGHVLVVDDDEAMCETVAECLSRRGYTVTWRTSAREALALIDAAAFDAVFTDLHMPGMDGLVLCRQLGATRPELPVVVASAFGSTDVAGLARAAGAFDFVGKPFDIETLRNAVDRAVAHGRELAARRGAPQK